MSDASVQLTLLNSIVLIVHKMALLNEVFEMLEKPRNSLIEDTIPSYANRLM